MRKVMTDHFWIYWAVTCPLTIFVTGIVIVFAFHQTRKKNAAAADARRSVKERNA